jgi:hypothetical protein
MELVIEPDMYEPSIDEQGNYVDKMPSFHIIKKGISCPCGSRKGKTYETVANFSNHIKTKHHEKWLTSLNLNKTNYYVENIRLKETIENQKLIIAKMEKEIINRNQTIYCLMQEKTAPIVDDLLLFD